MGVLTGIATTNIDVVGVVSAGCCINGQLLPNGAVAGTITGKVFITGALKPKASLTGIISPRKIISGTIQKTEAAAVTTYTGEYEATPKTGAQTLATADRYMQKDVVVHAVPYYEVKNEAGGNTIIIGG